MATAAVAPEGERPSAPDGARVSSVWALLICVVATLVLVHDVTRGAYLQSQFRGSGDIGFSTDACDGDAFCKVVAVTPGGPAAAARMRVGDTVRPDRGMDLWRDFRPGETLGVTVRRGGQTSHPVVTASPYIASAKDKAVALSAPFYTAAWALTCMIGVFVALRSRGRASTLLFGGALVCLGLIGANPSLWESGPWVYPAFRVISCVVFGASPILFLAFALAARREAGGRIGPIWNIVLLAYGALQAAVLVLFDWWPVLTGRTTSVTRSLPPIFDIVCQDLGYLLAFVALGVAWRESRGQARVRFAFILLAYSLLSLSLNVTGMAINLTGNDWSLGNPLILFVIFGSATGASVFAYAVLRHRVVDIGFAVNRTLVYAVVSAVLLAGFGLIEWAADHLVRIEGREKNALIDAAIAVGVFLTFHRVRDGVEHVVERLFFRHWQEAEAGLRRFVREAAFATRGETLTRGFSAALMAYAEGAQAAVYLRAEDGGYRLAGGEVAGVDEALDPDDPAIISIRAEPKAMIPEQSGSSLKTALAAPMIHRNEMIGLAVLGPKASGLDFRPDEVELIGWATRQVGLDLHALKMEQLEAGRARQAKRISVLNAKIEGLLAGRQSA